MELDPQLRIFVNGLQVLTRAVVNGSGDWTKVEPVCSKSEGIAEFSIVTIKAFDRKMLRQ